MQQSARNRARQADDQDRYYMEQATAEEGKRVASIFQQAAEQGLSNVQKAKALQKVSRNDASLPMLIQQAP